MSTKMNEADWDPALEVFSACLPLRGAKARDDRLFLEAVEFANLEWVDWFNHRRLLEPNDDFPPAEAEARFLAQPEELAMVA